MDEKSLLELQDKLRNLLFVRPFDIAEIEKAGICLCDVVVDQFEGKEEVKKISTVGHIGRIGIAFHPLMQLQTPERGITITREPDKSALIERLETRIYIKPVDYFDPTVELKEPNRFQRRNPNKTKSKKPWSG